MFDPLTNTETPTERVARVRVAESICSPCPGRQECLAAGLAGKESGVWGGVLLNYGTRVDDPRLLRDPDRHGTYYSYRRHLNRREVPCAECRDAYRVYRRIERNGAA
jgi:hypothetical protein